MQNLTAKKTRESSKIKLIWVKVFILFKHIDLLKTQKNILKYGAIHSCNS